MPDSPENGQGGEIVEATPRTVCWARGEDWNDGSTSLVFQIVKNLPTMLETWVWSLGQEDPLEKETEIHSSIPAWRIAWTGSLAVLGLQRIGHHLATKHNNNDLVRHLWLVCQFTNSDTGWAPTVCETVHEVLEILGGHKEAGKTELMQNVSFLLQTHRHVRQI